MWLQERGAWLQARLAQSTVLRHLRQPARVRRQDIEDRVRVGEVLENLPSVWRTTRLGLGMAAEG